MRSLRVNYREWRPWGDGSFCKGGIPRSLQLRWDSFVLITSQQKSTKPLLSRHPDRDEPSSGNDETATSNPTGSHRHDDPVRPQN